MRGYLEKREEQRLEQEKLYSTPSNRRLKYIAIGVAGICIILMLVMIIWYDQISWRMMLIMRGSAGLSAITYVILVAVLVYRVSVAYFKKRSDNGK